MCSRNGDFGWVHRSECGYPQPISLDCGDPLCPECERQRANERRQRWEPVLKAMKSPRLITLTVVNGQDLAERIKFLQRSIRKLFDLRLGPRRWPALRDQAKQYVRQHYTNQVDQAKVFPYEAAQLVYEHERSIDRFGETIQRYRSSKGEWPRMRAIIGKGFADFEVTYLEKGWHPHRHISVDGQFIPWSVLCVAWQNVTTIGDQVQGKVVHIEAIDKSEKSIKEAVKYLTKPWDVPADKQDEFRRAVRGIKRVWPIGGAKPVEPEHVCPHCGSKTCKAAEMEMAKLIREEIENGVRTLVLSLPEGRAVKVGWNAKRREWEALPLYSIIEPFACHSEAACGPGGPLQSP